MFLLFPLLLLLLSPRPQLTVASMLACGIIPDLGPVGGAHAGFQVWGVRSFADKGTEDVFDGFNSKEARATCPSIFGSWRGGTWTRSTELGGSQIWRYRPGIDLSC